MEHKFYHCCFVAEVYVVILFVVVAHTSCYSIDRPLTVFEVMSNLWNSEEFNPIAPASECHADYFSAIDCSHVNVGGLSPATAQRIEDLMVSMRSDLIRIITRWEQSGQGEGGRDVEEEEEATPTNDDASSSLTSQGGDDETRNIGALSGRPPRALQTRASFLNGRPSYLLYFWEIADTHQVLQSSLQRLNNSAGASDASRAPISSASNSAGSSRAVRRRQQQQQELDDQQHASLSSLIPLMNSIKELAERQCQMIFERVEDRNHKRDFEEKL